MFSNLSERLSKALKSVRGLGKISEDNVRETLREIRLSLLEADVALPVIKSFIDDVKTRAMGQDVMQNINPGQAFVKIINDEMIKVMGSDAVELNLKPQPTIILMAGLQGSGKTTTVAKLARYLKEQKQKSVLVTSCDIYRPAAIDQLETLANEVGAHFCHSQTNESVIQIAKRAIEEGKKLFADVLIVDTAGRLHIDTEMMSEIKTIHAAIEPHETLFVVDSMTGQDAANTAKAFDAALPLTGVVLTKTDGDARGGAALSVSYITQKPIKFMGSGEKTTALEVFYPERIVSRILGMGDILSLVEEAERKIDKNKSKQLAKNIRKGQFDLEDFRNQIVQMEQLGGMSGIMAKLPGMGNMPQLKNAQLGEKQLNQTVAIINSMTIKERRFPDLINGSRKKRIAQGSGTSVQEINKLLSQFKKMKDMMKKMSKPGAMQNMMRNLQGKLPPNFMG